MLTLLDIYPPRVCRTTALTSDSSAQSRGPASGRPKRAYSLSNTRPFFSPSPDEDEETEDSTTPSEDESSQEEQMQYSRRPNSASDAIDMPHPTGSNLDVMLFAMFESPDPQKALHVANLGADSRPPRRRRTSQAHASESPAQCEQSCCCGMRGVCISTDVVGLCAGA